MKNIFSSDEEMIEFFEKISDYDEIKQFILDFLNIQEKKK